MKTFVFFLGLLFLFCSACAPNRERDFRFESKKNYHLIYMSCSEVPKSYREPSQGMLKVYMLVFTTDELDVNGQHFKPRTYYVERKNITFVKSLEPVDSIRWKLLPNRRTDDFVEAPVTITSNDKMKWDIYDNPC